MDISPQALSRAQQIELSWELHQHRDVRSRWLGDADIAGEALRDLVVEHWVRVPGKTKRHLLAGEQGWRCCYCGVQMTEDFCSWDNLTIDHVTPRKHGGVDRYDNCVAACAGCNDAKADRLFRW